MHVLIAVGYLLCRVIHIHHPVDFQQKRLILKLSGNGDFQSQMFTIDVNMLQ